MRPFKALLIWVIKAYRYAVSPFLPASCRFTPTCSEYMIQAIERHGVGTGVFLGFKRLCRCNPFCPGGHDPVPEKKSDREHRKV
ncbi:MAG TPA: membrane protein insertion efficiency factor YidD [Gammaproteobacteria bacterium]|nr:membrane protein insertion efficiency factor YidD [Gammaproteobacteria bacterium]